MPALARHRQPDADGVFATRRTEVATSVLSLVSRTTGIPSMPAVKRILVVDDEPKIVQLARDYLEQAGEQALRSSANMPSRIVE